VQRVGDGRRVDGARGAPGDGPGEDDLLRVPCPEPRDARRHGGLERGGLGPRLGAARPGDRRERRDLRGGRGDGADDVDRRLAIARDRRRPGVGAGRVPRAEERGDRERAGRVGIERQRAHGQDPGPAGTGLAGELDGPERGGDPCRRVRVVQPPRELDRARGAEADDDERRGRVDHAPARAGADEGGPSGRVQLDETAARSAGRAHCASPRVAT